MEPETPESKLAISPREETLFQTAASTGGLFRKDHQLTTTIAASHQHGARQRHPRDRIPTS